MFSQVAWPRYPLREYTIGISEGHNELPFQGFLILVDCSRAEIPYSGIIIISGVLSCWKYHSHQREMKRSSLGGVGEEVD